MADRPAPDPTAPDASPRIGIREVPLAQPLRWLAAGWADVRRAPLASLAHGVIVLVGGWIIVAIHESKQSWERFRDDILMPRLQQGVKGGFAGPPQETTFEVHNLRP